MIYLLSKFIKIPVNGIKYGISSLCGDIHDRRNKWTIRRYVLSYLIGISFAFLFWKFFIQNLDFSLDFTYGLLIAFIIILGLGFVFTTIVKCISILTCVGLVGKTGRGFIRAMCVAYIISVTGPVSNLALNGQEVVRVFSCATILTYNLTKTRFDLMAKPFQNTLVAMKEEVADIRKSFDNIEDVLKPIKDEIESDFSETNSSQVSPIVERFIREDLLSTMSFADPSNETKRINKAKIIKENYSRKMQLRCREQLVKGESRCKDAFSTAHDKCVESLPVVVDTLLCWPLRIDYVCNMKLLGYQETGGICDAENFIDPKLGENMLRLEDMEESLFKNVTDVKISFEVVKVKQPPQLKAAQETASVITHEFNKKKKTFDYIMSIMQRILSFVFLRVIYASFVYHRNYLEKIDFDNLYITPYFKKIDQRRRQANQQTLLPLKKQTKLVDIDKRCVRTKAESRATTFLLLQFILEALISGFFLLLDHMVVVLLGIVASKSEITYYQEGEHIISSHINGTGLMARLMKKTMKNFNMHERVSTFLTNKPCLPKPSVLSRRYYLTLAGLYVVTLALIYYSSTTLRARMYICSFFYRKREKRRTLHLYNKMLKQRKSFFETMYRKVKDDLEAHKLKMTLNVFLWFRLKFSKLFGWLRWFRVARRNCLVCEELEPITEDVASNKFVVCNNWNCQFIYCEECWRDIGENCLACQSEENVIKWCSSSG